MISKSLKLFPLFLFVFSLPVSAHCEIVWTEENGSRSDCQWEGVKDDNRSEAGSCVSGKPYCSAEPDGANMECSTCSEDGGSFDIKITNFTPPDISFQIGAFANGNGCEEQDIEKTCMRAKEAAEKLAPKVCQKFSVNHLASPPQEVIYQASCSLQSCDELLSLNTSKWDSDGRAALRINQLSNDKDHSEIGASQSSRSSQGQTSSPTVKQTPTPKPTATPPAKCCLHSCWAYTTQFCFSI